MNLKRCLLASILATYALIAVPQMFGPSPRPKPQPNPQPGYPGGGHNPQ